MFETFSCVLRRSLRERLRRRRSSGLQRQRRSFSTFSIQTQSSAIGPTAPSEESSRRFREHLPSKQRRTPFGLTHHHQRSPTTDEAMRNPKRRSWMNGGRRSIESAHRGRHVFRLDLLVRYVTASDTHSIINQSGRETF
jgi:hypothetical protein